MHNLFNTAKHAISANRRYARFAFALPLALLAFLLAPAAAKPQALSSGGTGRGATGVNGGTGPSTNPGTIGRTSSGSIAGTSGIDPNVSGPTRRTAMLPDSTGFAPGITGGFINRNPARRSTTAESKALAADIVDLPARSTLGAGASSSSRDTVVVPDPSRDSIRAD